MSIRKVNTKDFRDVIATVHQSRKERVISSKTIEFYHFTLRKTFRIVSRLILPSLDVLAKVSGSDKMQNIKELHLRLYSRNVLQVLDECLLQTQPKTMIELPLQHPIKFGKRLIIYSFDAGMNRLQDSRSPGQGLESIGLQARIML